MELEFPFDPVRRSEEAERLVMSGGKRLYHKFRAAPYYGGIATADAVGCSFLCAYCWNYGRNLDPARFGRFTAPDEVARILLRIARRRFFRLYRITGSEPILGEASFHHLLKVVTYILREEPRSEFVLETNGLLLGYTEGLAEQLRIPNLSVRVSLKGTDENFFEKITGARRNFFPYPLRALRNLEERGVRVWPALMGDFFTEEDVNRLKRTLQEFGIRAGLETESLEPYPFVLENLRKRGIIRAETL